MQQPLTTVNTRDLTPFLRAADLAVRLSRGEGFTAKQVAAAYGISRKSSYENLSRLSNILPLVSVRGVWRLADVAGLEGRKGTREG